MNIPLLCLPIAFLSIFVPKISIAMHAMKQPGGYNNKAPRDQQAMLEGAGKRAVAAHANGFEAFPAFAAGVLACTVTGAHPDLAAKLAIAHVVARLIYPWLYVANIDGLRSTVWSVGFVTSIALMVAAVV